MKLQRLLVLTLALCALGAALVPRSAHAIAAFARQYNTECSTCHDPYPHRNEFGEAFRKNGYVWPGKPPAADSGRNETMWKIGVPETLPLSVSLVQSLDYDKNQKDSHLTPSSALRLHAGGSIQDLVGFFAHDLTSSGGEAFAVFRHVASTPVNIRYGRLVPETTLWKPDQSFTLAPQATKGLSVAGEPALGTARDAAEANAVLGSRLFLAAGVSDRTNQNRMEYYGHASYKIGGTDFLGKEPDLDLNSESVWDYLNVTLGAYGYLGKTELTGDQYRRAGVEGLVQYKSFSLLLAGLGARDDNADGTGLKVNSAIFLGEVDYVLSSRYLAALRYEHEHVGNADTGTVRRVIGDLGWNPVENLSFKVQGVWARTDNPNADGDKTNLTGNLQISYSM